MHATEEDIVGRRPFRFSFLRLDSKGEATGNWSQKGRLEGLVLRLGKDEMPVLSIASIELAGQRLWLLLGETPAIGILVR